MQRLTSFAGQELELRFRRSRDDTKQDQAFHLDHSGSCRCAAHDQPGEKIQRADLLRAVQKSAAEQSKGATVRGYTTETEGGKLEYEVEMTVDGHSKDVSMDPDGNVLAVEEQVALDKRPGEVREGFQKRLGKARSRRLNQSQNAAHG